MRACIKKWSDFWQAVMALSAADPDATALTNLTSEIETVARGINRTKTPYSFCKGCGRVQKDGVCTCPSVTDNGESNRVAPGNNLSLDIAKPRCLQNKNCALGRWHLSYCVDGKGRAL